jgi:hypothetical protein
MTHPAAVTACNLDLENLITGKNEEGFFLLYDQVTKHNNFYVFGVT